MHRPRLAPALCVLLGTATVLAVPASPARADTRVSIHLDGALASQASALRALDQRGMRATLNVNSGKIGTSRNLSWSQVRAAAAAGHEIGAFSTAHIPYVSLITAQVRADACADRSAIQARGLGVSSFAYPFGLPSTAAAAGIEAAVRSCGYDTARTTTVPDLFAEAIPPVDPFATRAFQWDATHTLADLRAAVTGAESHGGGWVQYAFQDVCDGCDPRWSIPPATFTAFLDWLAGRTALGTVVQTPREVLRAAGVKTTNPVAPPPPAPAAVVSPVPPVPGVPATPGAPAARVTAPALRSVRLVRTRIRRTSRLAVRFRLDRDATIYVTAARRRAGRWVRTATSTTLQGDRGANTRRFPARLLRLRVGTYRLRFVATDALGRRSRAAHARVTITAR